MNINFIDARGGSPEQVEEKIKKSIKQPNVIHNVAMADLEEISNHLGQIPQVKIHSQFSNAQPQPLDIFLIDEKHDFIFDGNKVSKKLKSKKKPQYDFKSIIEFSLNEVYIFNTTDYKFQFANQGALDNLGYTLKALKELTPVDIKPLFTKKDFNLKVQPLTEGIKEKIVFKTIHKRADKSLYPVEVHLQIMEHDGVPFFVAVILDITEWENALVNSKDSTTKMELLAKNYPGGTISLIDKDFNIIYTDGEGYRQHGMDPSDLIGKPMKDTVTKSVFKSLKDAAQDLKENRVSKYYVSFEKRTYENTLKSIYGNDHHFKYYVLRVNDITESIKAQEAILFERNRYASITEALENSALVSITDVKGTIIHANHQFCKASQYTEKELLGKSHSIINSGHHPKSFWVNMWKTVLKGDTWRANVKNKAKDGSYYWVDTVINPIKDVNGTITSFLSIRNLITHSVNAQEEILFERNRYASITKALEASALVSITDVKGTIIHVNQDFCKVSQYTKEELVDKSHSIINSGHHPKSFWTAMWKTVLKGKTWRAEVKNKAKDGSYYWVDTVINPVFNVDDKIETLLSIRYLVTERKELELDKDSLTNKIRLATKAAELGIWSWDPASNEVTWDENNFKLYGVDSYDGTFDGYMKMIHPDDVQTVLNEGKKISHEGSNINYGFRIIKPNGDIAHLKSMALKEQLNGKELIVGVNWDVTQEKEYENHLLQLTNKLSLATKAAKLAIWTWDLETGVVIWDDQMKAIFGRKDFNNTIETFGKYVHPDDVKQLFEEVNDQLTQKKGFNYSFRIIKPNNKVAHIKAMSSLEMVDGKEVLIGVNWDVTEENENENHLLDVTNKLRLATSAAEIGVWSNNLKTGEIEWDAKCCSIFGTKKFPGYKKWVELIHPDDKEEVLFLLDETINTHKNFDHTFRIKVKGKIKYIKSMGTRETCPENDILIGVTWDVTKDKVAEQELKTKNEALARLEKFINHSSDAIQVSDESGRLVYINDTAAERLGIDKNEVANYFVQDFEVLFKKDAQWKNHVAALKKKGSLIIESVNVNQATKTSVPIEVTVTYQKIGKEGYIIASSRDITERKEAEKKFELAIKGSNDGYFDADLENGQVYLSDRYFEILGLKGLQNLQERDFWESLLHKDDKDRIIQQVISELEGKSLQYEIEAHLIHTNGSYIPTLIRAYVTRDKNGKAIRVTGTLMDLSKIKAAEKEITTLKDDYANLLNSVDGIIWEGDHETLKFTFISDQIENILGYTQEEWYSEDGLGFDHLHPDDYTWVKKYCDNSLKKRQDFTIEYRMMHKSGAVVWVKDNTSLIVEQGKIKKLVGIMIDITDSKNMQLALEESQQKLKMISENATDGLVIFEDNRITYASKGFLNILGYSEKEALAFTTELVSESVHPEDREYLFNKVSDDTEKNASTVTYQFRQKHKKGHYIWREDTVNHIYDQDGKLGKQIIIARDITERKAIEIALSESEEKHRFIVESSSEIICTHQPSGEYKYVSPAVENITGYTPEELIGKDPYSFIHPDYKSFVLNELHQPILEGKFPGNIQYRVKKKNGEYIWLDTYMSSIQDDDGTIVSMISGSRDVTDTIEAQLKLKSSEERFRAIADNMPGVVYQCLNDDTFSMVYINEDVENLTGYSKEQFLNGKINFVKILHNEDKERVLKEVELALLKHEPYHLNYRLYNKKLKDYIWVEEFGQGVFEDEELSYLEGVILNVHESKLNSIALKESREMLVSIANSIPGSIERRTRDEKGNLTRQYVSKGAENLWELPLADIYEDGDIIWSKVHPEDRQELKIKSNKAGRLIKSWYHEFRAVMSDGRIKWVSTINHPSKQGDGQVIWTGLDLDITDRKIAEIELKKTLHQLNLGIETGKLGIWERDVATDRLDWNEQMFEIFGVSKSKFTNHISDFASLVHPEDLLTAQAEMGKMADGEVVRDVRFRIIRPDGELRHIYASGSPAFNDKGKVEKFIGINIDVTNVAEYQEQLEASLKEKDALFKELHHRIKNNLQMVSSLLFIKSTMTEDITLRRFIDETSTKIHSISSIHEQLLQLRGVNMLDIKDYLESLCQNLIHTYSYGNLNFRLNMKIDSAEMNIDKVLNIGLIVNEIISNSMKYAYPDSDTGEIHLTLKHSKSISTLTVSDNGIGIPSEKFANLDDSYGMQLISLFTKQIKGTLDIDNSKGTKYTIKFPTNV